MTSLVNDGVADITPGLFNAGIDGLFDTAGLGVVPVLVPGFVVPEPGMGALLLGGMAATWLAKRRRSC